MADRLNLAVQCDPAFTEIDYATWTGRHFEDLHEDPAWRAWNNFRGTAAVPGGESMLAVQARAIAGLMRRAGSHPRGEQVIVSRADVIKAILLHFLGMPLDMMRRLEIGTGSISQLVLFPEDARVIAVNIRPAIGVTRT